MAGPGSRLPFYYRCGKLAVKTGAGCPPLVVIAIAASFLAMACPTALAWLLTITLPMPAGIVTRDSGLTSSAPVGGICHRWCT